MKLLKIVMLLLGMAALVAGGVFLGLNWVDIGRPLTAANNDKSANLNPDPMPRIYLTTALAAVGGLLLGLGLGLPTRTAGAIRNEALDDAAARRSEEIRTRATGTGELGQG